MTIGSSTIPRMRVPAFIKSQLFLLDLGKLSGHWGMICCLPTLEFGEAVFLNQFHRTVQKEGAVLLGMLAGADPILDSHLPKAKALGIPLVADPLRRLHRALGLSGKLSSTRCQSFVFDPQGVIRYHLVHVLNWRGMTFLLEILKHCQDLYPQPSSALPDHPWANAPLISQPASKETTTATTLSGRAHDRSETSFCIGGHGRVA